MLSNLHAAITVKRGLEGRGWTRDVWHNIDNQLVGGCNRLSCIEGRDEVTLPMIL